MRILVLLGKPLDSVLGTLIHFEALIPSQILFVANDPKWNVLRQIVEELLKPGLDHRYLVLLLAAVIDQDAAVGSSVVSTIEASELLLA